MSGPQSYRVSFTIGIFVTLLLTVRVMAEIIGWQEQNYTTLSSVLADPSFSMFVIYFAVLMFCIWLIRGPNNKSMYLCWCMGYIVHYFLYWAGLESFLHDEQHKNIYVLNWLATVCVIPLLLLFRYRTYYSIVIVAVMIRYNVCRHWARRYFEELGTTDFEIKLRQAASLWFVIEFSYAAFLTTVALLYGVAPKESLWRVMESSGLFDPFPIYHWSLILVTVYFAILIFVNAIRDFNDPDYRTVALLTEREKRELIKQYKPSKFDPF